MMELRPYQQEAVDAFIDHWANGGGNALVDLATGCHAAGTQVLMHDGSVKAVEDVAVGDALMGPDSKPRHVLQLARGHEDLVRISPRRGATSFVVNRSHILPLTRTSRSNKENCPPSHRRKDNVLTTVKDWMDASKTFRHLHKLRRSGLVHFPEREPPMIPPWVWGALIGDGHLRFSSVSVTTMDLEVDEGITSWAESIGCRVRRCAKPNNKAWTIHIVGSGPRKIGSNPCINIIRMLGLDGKLAGEKRAPDSCRLGSVETRRQFLAGIIDTDGHLSTGVFDYVTKSKQLAEDVAFITRSLGLTCSEIREKWAIGQCYWRLTISGNIDEIPTRVPHKVALPRCQAKNHLLSGFEAKSIGSGDFYGFALDGDHLYLTADFVVHHNTGKSLVAANVTKRIAKVGGRVGIVTHVRELVRQNFQAMLRLWPQADCGIYSAGLGKKDARRPITFASIQSIYKRAELVGPWDLMLIDEVHLVPTKAHGTYRRFIGDMLALNPDMKVGGLTATPFRLGEGRIDRGQDRIFEETVYRYGIAEGIADGYLAPLVSKRGAIEVDVSRVAKAGGEFKSGELEKASRTITQQAVAELVERGVDRRSWLVFCAGVDHAYDTRDAIRAHGVTCETVTGNTPAGERDRIIEAFKAGQIRCLTNANVLTTGFDSPGVDLLAMMRPTLSTSLYVQMVGRGTRPSPGTGKTDCLVLDWAGNVRRHGPVDIATPEPSDTAPEKGDEGRVAESSVLSRECPECETLVHIAAASCPTCGYEWPRDEEPAHEAEADSETPILSTEKVPPKALPVVRWEAYRHEKFDKPPSMCVTFFAGVGSYREWIAFEHGGMALAKAQQWWVGNGGKAPFPASTNEALERFAAGEVAQPETISVVPRGKFHDIVARTHAPKRNAA